MIRDLIRRAANVGIGVARTAVNAARDRLGRPKDEPWTAHEPTRHAAAEVPADAHPVATIEPRPLLVELESATPPVLLDCRESHEWDAGYIDGATHIPMNELPERVGSLDPSRRTIVYCLHGIRSANVAMWLKLEKNFVDVASLDGGIVSWYQDNEQQRIRVVRNEQH